MKENIKGTIKLIGIGGAGTNIVGNISKPLSDLGNGFSNIEVDYIDTSLANIKKFEYNADNFHLIKSINVGEEISGSASERRENAKHIVEGIREFINKKAYTDKRLATYYILVASASGGSGSTAVAILAKHLLEKNLPVIVVLVGDSATEQSMTNTINTLASMDSVSKMTRKPLSMIYHDNASVKESGLSSKLEAVDKSIFKHISVLSAFLSGDPSALDQKDLAAFIDQSILTTTKVLPGLYSLDVFSKKINLPEYASITTIRTLTTPDISPDFNDEDIGVIKHYKFGTTNNANVIDVFNGQFPIHYVSSSNTFSAIEMNLKNKLEEAKRKLDTLSTDNITGATGATADDNGLVF